ncbi:transketolase family protein [Oenococcus sp. UCMA 17063]|nr:transketolase family protein [Oenococcus sp. UCMA 17063]
MKAAEKFSLRDAYGQTLLKLGRQHRDVVVFGADLSESTRINLFADEFPTRFFNVGIAEQSMIGTAAGISTTGLVPFVSTFALFAVERPFEQIRNSIAYPKMNVKIVSSHAGLSAGKDGGSHQAIEDISLMCSLPNMTVVCPCDVIEVQQVVQEIYRYSGPVYVRLTRMDLPTIHNEHYHFQIGKGEVLKKGDDITIIATGSMVSRALEAAEQLKSEHIVVSVLNIPTIKPLDLDLILKFAANSRTIVVAEDHSIYGGLYSSICELLSENNPIKVKKIGILDRFGQSGTPDELFNKYGLTVENIVNVSKKAFYNK